MSDRPLTTGEGNTAQVERDVVQVRGRIDYPSRFNYIHSLEALDRLARDAAECGRLRAREEQLSGWYNRAEQHITELKADVGRLREQLDAAEAKAAACPVCSQIVPGPSWRKA